MVRDINGYILRDIGFSIKRELIELKLDPCALFLTSINCISTIFQPNQYQ
jgi:hypothetical protein